MKKYKHILLGAVLAICLICTFTFGFYDIDTRDDNTLLYFGSGRDVSLQFDGTNFEIFSTAAADIPFVIGGTTYGFDITYYFETDGYISLDYDGDIMTIADDMSLLFGEASGGDVAFVYDETTDDAFEMTCAAVDTAWKIGDTTHAFDITYYYETSGTIATDSDAQTLTFDGADLVINDSDILTFGDSTDVSIAYDGTNNDLDITSTTALDEISFGASGDGYDVVWHATTAADNITFDYDAEALAFVGANATFDSDSIVYDAVNAGTKTTYGQPITIIFAPTTGETLTYTVPTGYDLVVYDCVGWKTAAAGDNAADQWDLQNNDGSAANIFDTEELNAIADKAMCQFDNLDDGENEIEAGNTLDLVAGEDTDDDGADGLIYVYAVLKTAD